MSRVKSGHQVRSLPVVKKPRIQTTIASWIGRTFQSQPDRSWSFTLGLFYPRRFDGSSANLRIVSMVADSARLLRWFYGISPGGAGGKRKDARMMGAPVQMMLTRADCCRQHRRRDQSH